MDTSQKPTTVPKKHECTRDTRDFVVLYSSFALLSVLAVLSMIFNNIQGQYIAVYGMIVFSAISGVVLFANFLGRKKIVKVYDRIVRSITTCLK